MSNGTLAEKRTLVKTTTTEKLPIKEVVPEVSTTTIKLAEEQPPLKEPIAMLQTIQAPVREPQKEQKCSYCKAKEITTLAIRGSVVLVLLALCFNLIKTATK